MHSSELCTKEYIIDELCLVDSEIDGTLRIDDSDKSKSLFKTNLKNIKLNSYKNIHSYFEYAATTTPDSVLRPSGDTTYFTSAGIQHVETLIREKGRLEKHLFAVAQPVVRSQYLDKVKEGISSSFIDYSVDFIGATPEDFIKICVDFFKLIFSQGINKDDLRIRINKHYGLWGNKRFSNIYLTTMYKTIELGECVYIYNYPVTNEIETPIVDVCFGVERLNWGLQLTDHYFPEFKKYYECIDDKDMVAAIVDTIRTATLIAGQGITPSHKDPGYRLRQLMKRFLSRTKGLSVDLEDLVRISFTYWKSWDVEFLLSENSIFNVLKKDDDRNYNLLFLDTLEKNGGSRIHTDVNKSRESFTDQLKHSVPKKIINNVAFLIEQQ